MGFKFACADFTFPLLPHDNVLKLISLMNYQGVDIGLFEDRSHVQPSDVFDAPFENGKKMGDKVKAEGLEVADVFLQLDLDFTPKAINHPDGTIREEARDAFLKLIEYAKGAESKHITCLPGVHFEQEDYEESFARAKEELGWRAEKAKEVGLIFSVEPHLGSIIDTPAKALLLVQEVDGLTLTLDYTHFAKVGIPDSEVHPLIPYASHFHARGAKEGMLQCVIEENAINYDEITRLLIENDYKGFLGVEYTWTKWEQCNRSDNVSECIQLKQAIEEAYKKYSK